MHIFDFFHSFIEKTITFILLSANRKGLPQAVQQSWKIS